MKYRFFSLICIVFFSVIVKIVIVNRYLPCKLQHAVRKFFNAGTQFKNTVYFRRLTLNNIFRKALAVWCSAGAAVQPRQLAA